MAQLFHPSRVALAIALGIFASTASFGSPVYTGSVCSENVCRLTNEVSWTRSLKDAQQEAEKEGKLVLWIHMVGKIEGFT
ncbi:MAG: hypothetical protein K2X93_12660 [Candidatus Obscuribacterales bacterium]|nr:hypothetical protein [Candidatus Obscuribacterales bacterium]